MSGRVAGGKINSKEKSNQQIRNVLAFCNLHMSGEQEPWFGV